MKKYNDFFKIFFKKKVISNFFQISFLTYSSYAINFIFSILLMANLDPNDYGIFAILVSYFAIIEIILSPNFGNILINIKSNDKLLVNFFFIIILNGICILIFTSILFFFLIYLNYEYANYLFLISLSKIINLYPNLISSYYQKILDFKKGILIINFSLTLSIIISYLLSFYLRSFELLIYRELMFSIIALLLSICLFRIKFNFKDISIYKSKILIIYAYKYSFSQIPQNFFQPLINFIVHKFYGLSYLGILTQSLYIFNSLYKLIAVFTDQILFVIFSRLKKIKKINFYIINSIFILSFFLSLFLLFFYNKYINELILFYLSNSQWHMIVPNIDYLIILLVPMILYSTLKSFLSSERRYIFIFINLFLANILCPIFIIINYYIFDYNIILNYIFTYTLISISFYAFFIIKN